MKKTLLLLVIAGAATSLFAQKTPAVELKTSLDSVNYAYGMNIANNLKRVMDSDLNIKLFLAGLNDVISGSAAKLSNDKANASFNDYNTKVAQPRITGRWKDENTNFL